MFIGQFYYQQTYQLVIFGIKYQNNLTSLINTQETPEVFKFSCFQQQKLAQVTETKQTSNAQRWSIICQEPCAGNSSVERLIAVFQIFAEQNLVFKEDLIACRANNFQLSKTSVYLISDLGNKYYSIQTHLAIQ